MINEIKIIIDNYLNNAKLTKIVYGTYLRDGVKITDKLTIPIELVHIPSWLKSSIKTTTPPTDGGQHNHTVEVNTILKEEQKVVLIRDHGGQKYFILDVID